MTTLAHSEVRKEVLGPVPEYIITGFGPVWKTEEDGSWLLPESSLGWGVVTWGMKYLNSPDGDGPWTPTLEQTRFLLWFYAVDRQGRWVTPNGILQRSKGWGKDPLAAAMCAIELVGPCVFSHWVSAEGVRLTGWEPGAIPVGRENRVAWIYIVGTALDQTKNTTIFLQSIFTKEAKALYNIEVNKTIVYAYGASRRIEAVTSNPATIEGNRPTFAICNETHLWTKTNGGKFMMDTVRRNLAKGAGRRLSITNAYDPAQESVAQGQRESYEADTAKGVCNVLYDSLEAPENAPLFPDYTEVDLDGNRVQLFDEFDQMIPPSRELVRHHLRQILLKVRGDSFWMDPEPIIDEILDLDNSPSTMRRFYFNSIETGDDEFLADGDIMATIHPRLAPLRAANERGDVLRLGWGLVTETDPIVMFFDGSKSDDSTAIVGCRISDGYIFLIGLWEKPKGDRGNTWLAPRADIDGRVHEAMARFNVVAFWADPSHAKNDEDGTRYWDALIDAWHVEFHERLQYWAVKGGDRMSSIMWDMASPTNQVTFSQEVVRFRDEMDLQTIVWDGHPGLRSHLRNARASFGPAGLTIRKPARGSRKKIDAGVCAIGAKMLARLVTIKGVEDEKPAGNIWLPRGYRR